MSAWIELPLEEVASDYRSGAGMEQLARAYGVARNTIRNRLLGIGVTLRGPGDLSLGNNRARKRGGPLRLAAGGYLSSIGRNGKSAPIHRACWEAHNGPVPAGWVVHHLDEDLKNNEIRNLVAMSDADHRHIHRGPREVKR